MKTEDLYKILNVRPDASPEAIKNAYRQLARTHHPDVNSAPDAEERMKALNRAYNILSDPERRRQYDRDHTICEPIPIRRETTDTRVRPPAGFSSAGPKQSPPKPAQPPPTPDYMAYAAGICVLLLILVVVGIWTSETASDESQVVPAIVTPSPLSPEQKTFDDWKAKGDMLIAENLTWEGLAAYDQALKIQPNASELWIVEGDHYELMGHFEKAITCYDRALKASHEPSARIHKKWAVLKDITPLINLAELLIDHENYAGAIRVYDNILAAELRNPDLKKRVLSGKIYALQKSGRSDEAASISKAVGISGTS